MAWYKNFKQAWPELEKKYGERFFRMWEYYLLSCAGGFRCREMQLWQIVMTKPGKTRPKNLGRANPNQMPESLKQ